MSTPTPPVAAVTPPSAISVVETDLSTLLTSVNSGALGADVTSSAFWTSPSTYVTLTSYVLPLLALIFHKDYSAAAQAISGIAPIIATGVLLVMRGLHKQAVIKGNTAIQSQVVAGQHALVAMAIQRAEPADALAIAKTYTPSLAQAA